MIRSTQDPGPSLLAVVVLVCGVILAALYGAGLVGQELDEVVRRQVVEATCADERDPIRGDDCEGRP